MPSVNLKWQDVIVGLVVAFVSIVFSTVLVQHTEAIANVARGLAVVEERVEGLEARSLTISEREKLCSAIAVLEATVRDLKKEVDELKRVNGGGKR